MALSTGRRSKMTEGRLVYTPQELCDLLGLSRTAVYERLREGSLPSIRVGRRILIPRRALVEMLDTASGARPDDEEAEGHAVPDPGTKTA